MNPGS